MTSHDMIAPLLNYMYQLIGCVITDSWVLWLAGWELHIERLQFKLYLVLYNIVPVTFQSFASEMGLR